MPRALVPENGLLPACLSEGWAAVASSVTSGFSAYMNNVSLAWIWLEPDMEIQLRISEAHLPGKKCSGFLQMSSTTEDWIGDLSAVQRVLLHLQHGNDERKESSGQDINLCLDSFSVFILTGGHFFIAFREKGWEGWQGERERNIDGLPLVHTQTYGLSVPGLGMEPTTFPCTGGCSNHLSRTGQGSSLDS